MDADKGLPPSAVEVLAEGDAPRVSATDKELIQYLDQYGAPIFHEVDGLRYWGQAGHAEALGLPLEEMTWTEEEIQRATVEAMRRRAQVEELQEEAKALEIDDDSHELAMG